MTMINTFLSALRMIAQLYRGIDDGGRGRKKKRPGDADDRTKEGTRRRPHTKSKEEETTPWPRAAE